MYGGFLKWWYQTTIGFPTKKGSCWGVKWGVPPTLLGSTRSLKILKRRCNVPAGLWGQRARLVTYVTCVQIACVSTCGNVDNVDCDTDWFEMLCWRILVLRGITMHTDLFKRDHQITSSHHSHNLPQDIDGGEVQLDCGPEHLLDLAEVPNDANGVQVGAHMISKPFKGGNVGFLHVNVCFICFCLCNLCMNMLSNKFVRIVFYNISYVFGWFKLPGADMW